MQPVNVKICQNLTGQGRVVAKNDIRFSVNAQAADYLVWLAKNTVLGKTANEVAAKILIQRLTEMRQENYVDSKSL